MKKILFTIILGLLFLSPNLALAGCTTEISTYSTRNGSATCSDGSEPSPPDLCDIDAKVAIRYSNERETARTICCCQKVNSVNVLPKEWIIPGTEDSPLNVPLSGADKFDTPNCTVDETTGLYNCQINWIGTYINGVYRLAIGMAAILAFLMILMGGMAWNESGGNQEKISEAKKRITSGILGLLLVMLSALFLNVINTDLTSLKPLSISLPKVTTTTSSLAIGCPDTLNGGRYKLGECPSSNGQNNGLGCVSCNDCIPLEIPTKDGDMANRSLAVKLQEAYANYQGWKVTEAWPPTVCHYAQDQWSGDSVDVGFDGNPDIKHHLLVSQAILNAGLRPELECAGSGCCSNYGLENKSYASLVIDGQDTGKTMRCLEFADTSHITGTHLSIYRSHGGGGSW